MRIPLSGTLCFIRYVVIEGRLRAMPGHGIARSRLFFKTASVLSFSKSWIRYMYKLKLGTSFFNALTTGYLLRFRIAESDFRYPPSFFVCVNYIRRVHVSF